jgi:hypothetical protein
MPTLPERHAAISTTLNTRGHVVPGVGERATGVTEGALS